MKKYVVAGASLLAGVVSATSLMAADMPLKAAAYKAPPPEIFNWTGFYIGVHGGGGWGSSDAATVPQGVPGLGAVTAAPVTTNSSGGLAGGQIGYNYQTGMWVWGAEAQASWANLTGSSACSVAAGGVVISTACLGSAKVDALGTVAGRLGIAFDRVLFYGKGGGAWTSDSYQTVLTAPLAGFNGTVFNASDTRWGWMVGVGAEYAFTPNWSAKLEYNYMDLGTQRLHFTSVTTALTSDVDIRQRVNVVKAGINYRFGGPVVAKY
jgi:outer membrane immunogenic protein